LPENIVWDKEINPDALADNSGIKWDKNINPAIKEPTKFMVGVPDRGNQVIKTADKPGRFGKFTQDIDDYLESNKVTSGVYGDIKNFFTSSKEEDVADAGIRLQIAEETGIPMQHVDKDVMRNYAEAQGAYTQPTNKQVMGGLMTASLAIPGGMVIAAPTMATKAAIALKTAVGVGTFGAIEEGINYLASTIKNKEYRFGAGESFAPEDSSQTVKDLFYVGELIAGGVAAGKAIGGAKWGAEKIKENFLRETIETYNMPRTIYISPEKIREFHGLGREDVISPAESAILKDMGLTREDYVSGLKNGIDLELPVERIVTIADKPWVKSLKDYFRMAPYLETKTEIIPGKVKGRESVPSSDNTGEVRLLEEKGSLAGEAVPPLKVDVKGEAIPAAGEKVELTATSQGKQPWEMTKSEFEDGSVKEISHNAQILTALNKRFKTEEEALSWIKERGLQDKVSIEPVYHTTGKGKNAVESIKGYTVNGKQGFHDVHRQSIEQALSEGKPVPESVLKDYPDLQKAQEGKQSSNVVSFKDKLQELETQKFMHKSNLEEIDAMGDEIIKLHDELKISQEQIQKDADYIGSAKNLDDAWERVEVTLSRYERLSKRKMEQEGKFVPANNIELPTLEEISTQANKLTLDDFTKYIQVDPFYKTEGGITTLEAIWNKAQEGKAIASDESLPLESTITRGEEDDINTLLTLAAKQDEFQSGTPDAPPEYDAIRSEASRLALESVNKQMAMEARKHSSELKKQGLEMAKADPTFLAIEGIVKDGGIKHSTLTKLYDSYTIKEIARKRPGLVSKSGTMGADEFAQEYGFENDEALIQSILKWEGVKAFGEKMAGDFEKQYLSFMSDSEGIDFHIKFLEEEQKILAKLMKANAPKPATGLKKVIREQTGQLTVDDIMVKSSDALRAGLKKSEQAARKAYKEGNLDGVMKEKERQIELALNLKYRTENRNLINKMHSEIGKIVKDDSLPEYYRDAIQNYLADYDLLPRSSKGRREVESTRSFIDRMEAEGETVDIPRAMMDKIERYGKTHWRELSVDELVEIYDQAKLFQHLGKLKNKLMDIKEKRDFETVVTNLLDNMQTNWPEINRQPTEKEIQDLLMPETLRQQVESNIQSFRNSLVKGEYFIRRFDKWEDLGPAWKQLYEPIYKAYGTEFVGLEKITAKLEEIFKPFTSKRGLVGRPWVDEIVEVEGVPQKLTKEQMIMVALNSGNAGNRATFTGGELQWTDAQIDAVVKKLSPEEMKFVEDVWKLFEDQLPALKDVYKQLNGIDMKTVEGKYFPIVLDQKLSWIADQRAAEENARNFFKSIYPTDAKVVTGSTIERVGTTKNVKLSFDVIFQKLSEVNHYSSHVLPVRDVVKILKDDRVRMAISTMPDDIGGPEVYKEMMKWIQDVAVERKEPLSKVEDWMSTIRNNTTMVALGLKFSVGLFQGLGATMTIEQLAGGTKAFTDAGYEFYRDRAGMIDQIKTMSTEMRARPHSWDRELQDAWGRLGLEHFKGSQKFKDFCFSMITLADMEVSYISWIAGFNEGMLKFKGSEPDAVMFADSVVRKSQGVSMTKDLANVQKGSELKHMVTMFYTFFNSMENQMIERGLERKYGERAKMDITRSWWWIVIAPAVLGFMLNERRVPNSPGELAKEVVQYRMAAIPFVRDLSSAALKGYDYQFSPAAKGGKVFSDTIKHGEKFISGDEEFSKLAGSAFEASGYAFGIPTAQALITVQGLIDLNNGYTSDLTRLLFRAPREDEEE